MGGNQAPDPPSIVDIPYNGKLALLAIAQGGRCRAHQSRQLARWSEMFTRIVSAARAAGITMRIGVNPDSIDARERGPQMRKISMKMRDDGTPGRTDPAFLVLSP
jgi:4-hydroxy-3-methylbut-2-en-1-yl diphosphate synthase IspG/GcpE